MPLERWDTLPEDARIWVFGTGRALTPHEETRFLATVDGFLDTWNAHGQPLRAGRSWREGRFLLVGVDESSAPPSGCSIDALIRSLSELERELAVELVGHGQVFYRDSEGQIRRGSRSEVRASVDRGQVDASTPVFDLTVTRRSQVKEGAWERPAADTWVGKAFKLAG